jgi:hypothetical protein
MTKAEQIALLGMSMASIIMESGDDTDGTDGTDEPVWFIASKPGLGHLAFHAGPFFSRRAADEVLVNRKHRFPKTAFVYCSIGHLSSGYRELRRLAKNAMLLAATEDGAKVKA